MRRLAVLASFVGLSALVGARSQTGVDPARMSRIWQAVEERTSVQGDHWFENGDFPRAVQLLRIRAELFPSDYQINTDLGWMLGNVKRYDEELSVYVRFRLANPGDPDSPFPEAYFYFTRKAYAKVPPLLEPTLKRKPHPNSYRTLAHAYERMGMLGDSKRVWALYIGLNKNDDAAKNNLSRIEKKIKGETIKPR